MAALRRSAARTWTRAGACLGGQDEPEGVAMRERIVTRGGVQIDESVVESIDVIMPLDMRPPRVRQGRGEFRLIEHGGDCGGEAGGIALRRQERVMGRREPVSYTHLTLPTN